MCNRYGPPEPARLMERWRLREPQVTYLPGPLFPRARGPFLRRHRNPDVAGVECVVGQWALVPWFAKSATLTYATNNARFEEIESKASYKLAWQRSQRCLIPADWFDEPCWETGRNVWWRFRRADGQAWHLAGLWNTWVDRQSGEVVESYTMLTINADGHPLMGRMHKPDPRLPPDRQDKRSVVAIPAEDAEGWLSASPRDAAALVRLTPASEFEAQALGL